ncbi:MAG TPA: ABC transporter permease [Prolixibacteraceae bacterium]|nr:ABC transporter permease [Prolixibacteraceae bacterium]
MAWRTVYKNKVYSAINITGLALGIASCMIIFLVVKYELGYDSFNKKADRIYRVTLNAIDFNPSVSMAVTPAMRTYFPELEQVSQVWYQHDGLVTVNNKRYSEIGYMFADAQFPKIFDYEWVAGNPATALSEPNSVVLTESIAQKYFQQDVVNAGKDVMGQVINLDNHYNLKVTGIIKDLPGNTNLPFIFMVSFETVKEDVKGMMSQFYNISGGNTYILIPPNYDIENMRRRIPDFIANNWGKDIAKEARLPLQLLKDIHFDQRYLNSDVTPTSSRETYWALAAVAIFIIIIASINFINLATAQAIKRTKEIGIRKVLGSRRSQLVTQFLGETTLMVIVALVLGILVTAFFIPVAAHMFAIKISITQLMNPSAVALLLLIVASTILLAGLYPAFVQSAFNPVQSLKSQSAQHMGGLTLRKALVVLQFVISQVMIIGTLVVAYQMYFLKNQDLGFDKEAVISFRVPDQSKRDVLAQQLQANPGVADLCFASGAPSYNSSYCDVSSPESGNPKGEVTELKFIDEHYTDLFKLNMLAGEKVTKKVDTDTIYEAVVNETLLQKLNLNDLQKAVGKHIMLNGRRTTIIGVVQDFQSESKHKMRRPCALLYIPRGLYSACIKLQPSNMQRTITDIDKTYSAMFPDNLFQYQFLDEHIANLYKQEEKEYVAFKLFSGIAIIIGCLGLYGLVAFAAAQRTKEVGIRKVLGASLTNIMILFSKEFAILISIAFIIAAPIAYYFMNNWLYSFAYQVNIGISIFVIALAATFLIAAFTIAFQAVKAAIANPVKSLRTE